MKPLLFCSLCLLAVTRLSAQSPAPGAPAPRIMTEGDLRKYLVGTTWRWEWNQRQNVTPLTFTAFGTARTADWTAKFVVKSPRQIDLQLDGKIARLTFNPSYTSYEGTDFGNAPVQGELQKPDAAGSAKTGGAAANLLSGAALAGDPLRNFSADSVNGANQLNKALSGASWTYQTGGKSFPFRFAASGLVEGNSGLSGASWRIISPSEVLLARDDGSAMLLRFGAAKTTFQCRDWIGQAGDGSAGDGAAYFGTSHP